MYKHVIKFSVAFEADITKILVSNAASKFTAQPTTLQKIE